MGNRFGKKTGLPGEITAVIKQIQYELMTNGPMTVVFVVYQDFFGYVSGRFNCSNSNKPQCRHIISIYNTTKVLLITGIVTNIVTMHRCLPASFRETRGGTCHEADRLGHGTWTGRLLADGQLMGN